jgi:ferritin
MLTSQKVIDAINEQIGYEFSAEPQYYAMGAHFASEALRNCRSIFPAGRGRVGHALRFIKYIVDAGGRVVIPATTHPIKIQDAAGCGEAFARSGNSRHPANQWARGTRAEAERLSRSIFFSVPD